MNLPMPAVPCYELTLPVSGKRIKYRPFLVKEEKVLLIANETDSIEQANVAIRNVVNSCTFNDLNLDKTPLADIEYLFIMIRAKSIGEDVQGEITCAGCNQKIDYAIKLDKIKVDQKDEMDPNVRISPTEVITMKYPSMSIADNMDDKEGADLVIYSAAACVDMITIDDTIYNEDTMEISDIVAFLENLSKKQLEMVAAFMDTIPSVVYEDDYKCPKCGHDNHIHMEGVGSFFA